MNIGMFAGNLGRNADLGSHNGQSVLNFSVAVNVGWGDNKRTLWVDCALWGERADKLAQYLTKGTKVAVSGDVDLRTYQKKDGTQGASLTCNVQRLTLQGGGTEGDQPAERPQQQPTPAQQAVEFNDRIPF